ncbi:hypothetical protein ACVWZD_005893 [Streptomyces sp. TE3672]
MMGTLTVPGTPTGSAPPAGGTHDIRDKPSNRALLKLGYIVFRAHGVFSLLLLGSGTDLGCAVRRCWFEWRWKTVRHEAL